MASLEIQARRRVNAALKSVRRIYRRGDSAGEVLERRLAQLLARKTRPDAQAVQGLILLYRSYQRIIVTELERALADLLTIAAI